MIAALACGLALFQAPVTVTYEKVPAEVSEVLVYEWRDHTPPGAVQVSVQKSGDTLLLTASSSALVIVMFRRIDGAYLIDGPLTWPSRDQRRIVPTTWRRTDRGAMPADAPVGASVEWLRGDALEGQWPRCFRDEAGWECWGIEPANRGVVAVTGERVWWTIGAPPASAPMRATAWGRMVRVSDSSTSSAGLRFTFAHPVAPPTERLAGFRLDTAAVSGVRAIVMAPGVAWVTGEQIPPKAWMDVRTERAGPAFIPLQDVANAPAAIPLHVRLPERRTVTGRVSTPGDHAAAGALITVFRAIDPSAPAGSHAKPRRVFAAETVANEDGTFQVDGIGEADYEIVAFHSQLGRASALLDSAQTEVVLRLAASGIVRGRVLAGGVPVDGVAIVSVPDAATFNAVADLTDAKGGDAKTGTDGRFSVMASAAGGGELRVGGGPYAVKRIALPRPPVPTLDLGDIDLGTAIELLVVLDRDPGCVVQAVGPVGRTGLQIVTGVRRGDGSFKVSVPEPGLWQFGLLCREQRRSLSPGMVQIGAANQGKEIRFTVR